MPIMIGQDPRNCPYPQNPSAIQIKLSRRFLVYFSAVVVPLESQKVSQHAVVCRTVTEELYAFEMIASARACFITQRVIRARKGEGVRQERKNQEQCPQSHLRWTQASVQWLDASNCTAGLASRVAWQPLQLPWRAQLLPFLAETRVQPFFHFQRPRQNGEEQDAGAVQRGALPHQRLPACICAG